MTSPNFQQKDTSSSFSFALAVLTSVITTLIVVLIFLVYIKAWEKKYLINPNNCVSLRDSFSCYIDSDWNSSNLLTVITSFYSNFIVLLVAIITLIGAVAVLSIRHSAKQHVDSELPIITANYFSTENGQKLLLKSTVEFQDKITELYKKNADLEGMVYSLIDRITKFEASAEETDTGATIQPAGPQGESQADIGDNEEEQH